eukprot:jgi/Chlat1/4833/Chrsp31S04869
MECCPAQEPSAPSAPPWFASGGGGTGGGVGLAAAAAADTPAVGLRWLGPSQPASPEQVYRRLSSRAETPQDHLAQAPTLGVPVERAEPSTPQWLPPPSRRGWLRRRTVATPAPSAYSHECFSDEVLPAQQLDSSEWWDWQVVREWDRREAEENGFVVVEEDDVSDAMAAFIAAYLSTIPDYQKMSPQELYKALDNALGDARPMRWSQRMWRWAKVLHRYKFYTDVAVSVYTNPLLVRAAAVATWMCVRTAIKLL